MTPEGRDWQAPKAVIFDLDHTLLDSRKAWQYALEESVAATCGRQIDVRPLIEEYHRRPWIQALDLLLPEPAERLRCEQLCSEISGRSGLKKLLVHQGIGMALDAVRAGWIEIGAISRQPHSLALKQTQSTGLDRFLSVLAATPEGAPYEPAARVLQCATFLERSPQDCVVISAEVEDQRAAKACGSRTLFPAWVQQPPPGAAAIPEPSQILESLLVRPPATRPG